jgi:hypothetical protein
LGTQKSRSRSRYAGFLFFWGFWGFVVLVFYLWGRVEIDFIIRENDALLEKKSSLQRSVDDLRIQVDTLKGYHRVVEFVKKRGMVSISANKLSELPVDLDGIEFHPSLGEVEIKYAGFPLFPMLPKRDLKSQNRGE